MSEPILDTSAVELREILEEREVGVKDATLEELNKRTRASKTEFWIFLLGRDNVGESIVEVPGASTSHGIVTSPELVVQSLKPHLEGSDLEVIADYHNHPSDSIRDYTEAGFPAEYAVSPSTADLRTEIPLAVQTQLGQKPYPRIIALNLPGTETVLLNSMMAIRYPTFKDRDYVEFNRPGFNFEPDDLFEITGEKKTNPQKMIERGLFQPVSLKVIKANGSTQIVQHPFRC
jgi:hypothetical protein